MAARRGRATRLALTWSLGSVVIATLAVALGLWLVDLLQYEGHCAGSLLPFVGDAQPRACSFSEYFDRNGLFTLRVMVATVWPIALLFVAVAMAFGIVRDRREDADDRT